ncbi:hypothetical protein G6L37_07185 [Agrobacterium rubi]|nr:hypothetical protein [Agrobacterium rubi]NTF25150.1 hypothetical protein [Agrobacterium rubi]
MRKGSRVREFFQDGGLVASRPDGSVARMLAGIGLAAMVSIVPVSVGSDANDQEPAKQAWSAPQPNLLPTHIQDEVDAFLSMHIAEIAENATVHKYGDYNVSHSVAKAIVRAARETDFPADYLMAIAEKESSFRANSKADVGSAKGYFGFIEQTWLSAIKRNGAEYGLGDAAAAIVSKKNKRGNTYLDIEDRHLRAEVLNLRDDAYVSAAMAALDLKDARKRIESRIDAVMEDKDLYLSHFLGEDAAEDIIAASETRPRTAARAMLPKAARFNKAMFHDNRGRPLSVAQFRERVQDVIAIRAEKYAGVDADIRKASLVPDGFEITGSIPRKPTDKPQYDAMPQSITVVRR